MNPSNPMFAKFDQALGAQTPTTQAPAVSTRANEIRNLDTTPAAPDESLGGFGAPLKAIGADFEKHNASIAASKANYEAGNESLPSTLYHAVGQTAGMANDVVGDVIKSAIKPEVLQSFGAHLAPLVEAAQNNPAGKAIIGWWQGLSPEVQRNLSDTGSIAALLSNAIGVGAAKEGAAPVMNAAEDAAKQGATDVVQPVVDATKGAIKDTVTGIKDTAAEATAPVREVGAKFAAEGNIPGIEGLGEQTQTSAERLAADAVPGGMGAAIKPTPLEMYDNFAKQEAKHLGDIKEDPAISLVGSRIGDAFDTVVKQRQEVGKTMADELGKTASKAVDTKGAFGNFQSDLIENGAHFDATTGELNAGRASKFSTADTNLLEKYATQLQALGPKPSMKSVDAFVSRMPKEIQGLKATANITFQTNAERLINGNLNELRTALGKAGTPAYNAARSSYADLSRFIDEGGKYLGKVTQSGDYAKDASIAKSSVQSVLNNGKKDWLLELENKTGYPAMDEATLALQAMKDAGDFKGNSLLELLTEGAKGAAHGPQGVAGAILGKMGQLAGKVIAGSKADQTRAFLKSLGKAAKK